MPGAGGPPGGIGSENGLIRREIKCRAGAESHWLERFAGVRGGLWRFLALRGVAAGCCKRSNAMVGLNPGDAAETTAGPTDHRSESWPRDGGDD